MTTKKTAIAAPAPAKIVEPSGAMIEPTIVEAIDTAHPAVDDNPRAHTTADQNRIDFNDPTKEDSKAVADNLKAAG